jgi:CheY-like chemotaxis protein
MDRSAGVFLHCKPTLGLRTLTCLSPSMTRHDPVMTSTRPRLVVVKGTVPIDSRQLQALKQVFDVIEVHSAAAARKMLDGSVGGVVVCAPGENIVVEGEPLPTAAATILERIGEGVGVVDAAGNMLWTDARLKMHDEQVRSEFVRCCLAAITIFNSPPAPDHSTPGTTADVRRQGKRFSFGCAGHLFELIVSPATLNEDKTQVATAVGVLWDMTAARRVQEKLETIDAAGADLLRIESAAVAHMNMGERLKVLEQKIIAAMHNVLHFDNFEVRLLDKESGQLELVISVNISPLKIGEKIYARAEGHGISGLVASTGRSYVASDVRNEPQYKEGMENARASLTVPLLLNDRVIGTLNIESGTVNAFDENDRRFAELFARYIAAALSVLDLLVIERYTTNQQMAQNLEGELGAPLMDLREQVKALRDSRAGDDTLARQLDDIARNLERVRGRLTSCTAGPRTILGAEQEMRKQERDPAVAGRRILIADDEPAIRDTLAELLTQKGADVTKCANGSETIVELERNHEQGRPFDIVLSDIRMPDRNGYEVYRRAKELDPNLPVILMTGFGYDPHHCIVRASQEGLQSFLFKPFKATQLMDVLKKTLAARVG